MPTKSSKISRKALTARLRELGAEIHDVQVGPGGIAMTRAEALADLIWRRALGWTDEGIDGKIEFHKPEVWAMQMIYERIEGRVPQMVPDEKKGVSLADKVGELNKQRLNATAGIAVSVSGCAGPVDVSDNGSSGAEASNPESSVPGTDPSGCGE